MFRTQIGPVMLTTERILTDVLAALVGHRTLDIKTVSRQGAAQTYEYKL